VSIDFGEHMSKLSPGKKMFVSDFYTNGYVTRRIVEVSLIERTPGGRWRTSAPFSFIYGYRPIFNDDFPCEFYVDEKDLLTKDEAVARKLMQ
jgi:hypothetical protein